MNFHTADQPTSPPIAPTPTTPSPTSADSISTRASPYGLAYFTQDRLPTDEEYATVAEVTRAYLEDFMFDLYGSTSLTDIDDFLTIMIRNSYEEGQPILVEYRSNGLFNPGSIFLPTTRELDRNIKSAFEGDNAATYISRLKALPRRNVFSRTEAISFVESSGPQTRSGSSSGSSSTAGIAAAAAGIVVLAAGLVILRRQRNSEEFDDDEFADAGVPLSKPGKDDSDDASTVAGETVVSTGSSSWRTGERFILDARDQDEDNLAPARHRPEPTIFSKKL